MFHFPSQNVFLRKIFFGNFSMSKNNIDFRQTCYSTRLVSQKVVSHIWKFPTGKLLHLHHLVVSIDIHIPLISCIVLSSFKFVMLHHCPPWELVKLWKIGKCDKSHLKGGLPLLTLSAIQICNPDLLDCIMEPLLYLQLATSMLVECN